MKLNLVEREFVYHGTTLADPNPTFSIEGVRSFYAAQFSASGAAVRCPKWGSVRSGTSQEQPTQPRDQTGGSTLLGTSTATAPSAPAQCESLSL